MNTVDKNPSLKESKKPFSLSEYTKQKRLLKESGLARLYKHWQEHESGRKAAQAETRRRHYSFRRQQRQCEATEATTFIRRT